MIQPPNLFLVLQQLTAEPLSKQLTDHRAIGFFLLHQVPSSCVREPQQGSAAGTPFATPGMHTTASSAYSVKGRLCASLRARFSCSWSPATVPMVTPDPDTEEERGSSTPAPSCRCKQPEAQRDCCRREKWHAQSFPSPTILA